MIVQMIKVEILGPKELLFETIEVTRRLGVLHLESDPQSVAGPDRLPLSTLQLPEKSFEQRIFYDDLAENISALLEILPALPTRQSYLHPLPVLDIIAAKTESHLHLCRQQRDRLTELVDEEKSLDAFRGLLQAIEPMLNDIHRQHELLDVFGLSFKSNGSANRLDTLLEELFEGHVIMTTATTPAGELVGIIAIEAGRAARLRALLDTENVPELAFPEAFKTTPSWKRSTIFMSVCGVSALSGSKSSRRWPRSRKAGPRSISVPTAG